MPPNPSTPNPTESRLSGYEARIEQCLAARLPAAKMQPERLHQAMRYAVTAGGKRVRPMLVYASAEALGLDADAVDEIAVALEYIHAYSLIHDDLPAMDDDDLRRGKPTCHVAFDEATAILAGDALQAIAFQVLVDIQGTPTARVALVSELARACGSRGMAGGQAIDLEAVGRPMQLEALKQMHAMKTGALIRSAVVMPAIAAEAEEATMQALAGFGERIGLAFQIRDDILDVEGETATLGKRSGADQALNKPTFPALLGMSESKRLATRLLEESLSCLSDLPGDVALLRHMARYIVERSY